MVAGAMQAGSNRFEGILGPLNNSGTLGVASRSSKTAGMPAASPIRRVRNSTGIKEREKENWEFRPADDVLKAASAFSRGN